MLHDALKSTQRWKLRHGVLLLHDNAPAQTADIATSVAAEIAECGYELLPHAPYSPDLAPSDFCLFPRLKKHLCGRQYASDNDIIQSVEDFLEVQDELSTDFYTEAVETME